MSDYNLAETLRQQLQGQRAPAAERDIETITKEILEAQRIGGEQTLIIGKGLLEVKAKLSHGEWLTWLAERVNYSERTAQRLMRMSPGTLAHEQTANYLSRKTA